MNNATPDMRILLRGRGGWRGWVAGRLIGAARRLEGGIYAEIRYPTALPVKERDLIRCLTFGAQHALGLIRFAHISVLCELGLRQYRPDLFADEPRE